MLSSTGPQIDQPIRQIQHVQIVLNDNYGVSGVPQLEQKIHELLDIDPM